MTAETEILAFVIGLVFGASLYVIAKRLDRFLAALEDQDVADLVFRGRP